MDARAIENLVDIKEGDFDREKTGKNGKNSNLVAILCGIIVGAVNGFFGGGGGMVVVPLLEKVLKKPTKTAHATAILIILPICVFSAIVYIVKGGTQWDTTLLSGGGVLVGGVVGALLLSRLSNKVIRIVFDVVMVVAGIRLMFF